MSAPLPIPALSLVVMIGASGCGKSTFAKRHFKPTEVLSSDWFRGMVADDEADIAASDDAFEVLFLVVRKRLAAGRLTVIDATNVQPTSRRALLALAKEFHVMAVAIVLDLPLRLCLSRNAARPDRPDSAHYVKKQAADLHRSSRGNVTAALRREGFRYVHVFESEAAVEAASFERQRLWTDRRHEHGPFDVIGDVHGCADELEQLLVELGYVARDGGFAHPLGRRLVFLGDLVDRGPRNLDVLRLVMRLCADGAAMCVPGNHDVKFMQWLQGRQKKLAHGLERTVAEVEALAPDDRAAFGAAAIAFIDGLVGHFVLDGGRLVVAHAGMKQTMQGRASGAVREFALYGETTGEVDEYGLPVRHPWAADYRGEAVVVYGHTPTIEAEWLNKTICIDTGCVFGGALTALRWPENELVSVPAAGMYYEPARPLLPVPSASRSAQHEHDDELDIADFTGKAVLTTAWIPYLTLQAQERAAALEAMSRFAVDPRWLCYLPPTMSPSQTSAQEGLLEHPDEALGYFREEGVDEVVCEQKHMGSRAVVVVCRDAGSARARFGVVDGSDGVVLTRTGRPFFTDAALHQGFLDRVRRALSGADFWQRFDSDWFVLDCELMPWSAKAQELLRQQYAAVGAAAVPAVGATVEALRQACLHAEAAAPLLQRFRQLAVDLDDYGAAWRRYCWPVAGIDDYRLAPFHLLAAEGRLFTDQPHDWHMTTLAELAQLDPGWLLATPWRQVALSDAVACADAVGWWDDLTAAGGEGMVVKPRGFVVRGRRGLVQPAIKCRGREYLRIIYGPNYTAEEHLVRLRKRGLGRKRALARAEFALGLEALTRFVGREPLRRVHECVLGVLALESEAVDPRL